MAIDWDRFRSLIQQHARFVLTSHIRPDCDALGSELGMAGVLAALGKQVRIVNAQATPPNYAFLDPKRQIQALGRDVSTATVHEADVLLVLDTSAWAQLGEMGDVLRGFPGRKLVLDHHQSSDDLGAEVFKDVQAEATGRLVIDAADALGVQLTQEIARPLFAALATDTGWYRFSSTSAGTYQAAARLVEAGAVPADIYKALYEQTTLARLRLSGLTLAHAQVELAGRLAHTYILQDDFRSTGALPADSEDLVNQLLSVAGTEVAVIFVEQAQGGFKISFRSRSAVRCNQLAERFGGGGHHAAAGAFVAGQLADVQQQVLDAVRAAMG